MAINPCFVLWIKIWITIIASINFVHGMKCEFCQKDFKVLSKHSWRCVNRVTSALPVVEKQTPTVSTTNQSSNTLTASNQQPPLDATDSATDSACVCSRKV